jgi:SAM-dependent methyltransferase
MGFTDLVGVDRFTRPIDEDGLSIRVVDDLESSDLGLGNMKFALVTMIEVIEHMTSPGVLLAHASQHLANDGVILITTPNIHSLIQRLKFLGTGRFGHFDAGSDPTHFQPLLLDAWERMLPKWNLEVERRWTIPDANVFGGVSFVWRLGASVLAPILGNPLPGECLGLMLRRVSIP